MPFTTVNRTALSQRTHLDSQDFEGQERSLPNEVNLSKKQPTKQSMSTAQGKSPHHPHVYRVNVAFVDNDPVVL